MSGSEIVDRIDAIVGRLKQAGWKERDAVRDELLAVAKGAPDLDVVREHLEVARGALSLELRWEIDTVLEAIAPVPEPEPEPEPEAEPEPDAPGRPLTAADLTLVYHDPRGFMLHKTKKGSRWLATEVDPRTGQPMTYELRQQEVDLLKTRLTGSPYWVIGAGEAPGA